MGQVGAQASAGNTKCLDTEGFDGVGYKGGQQRSVAVNRRTAWVTVVTHPTLLILEKTTLVETLR